MGARAKDAWDPLHLEQVPEFRPTEEQWSEPLEFIASIRDQAERYGLCKIVPPAPWKPPFALDKKHLHFPTRVQMIHELQDRSQSAVAQDNFTEQYSTFLRNRGLAPKKNPVFLGREIQLFRLYRAVQKRGGYEQVTAAKKWRDVAAVLQVPLGSSNVAYGIRQIYQKSLLDFEETDTNGAALRSSQDKVDAKEEIKSEDEIEMGEAMEAAEILGNMFSLEPTKPVPEETPPAKKRAGKKAQTKERKNPAGAAARTQQPAVRVPSNIDTLVCEFCNGGSHEEQIILCDKCDKGIHMYCLSPPLTEVPDGEWICPVCLSAESEKYAFKPGREYTWEEFEKAASHFRKSFWGGEGRANKASWDQLESTFWRLVEDGEEQVEVLYGADLDTGVYGSGFPRKDVSKGQYAEDKWNLNNIPKLCGSFPSVLRYIEDNIPGVMVPWLYIGMLFSSFCWHVEDHLFYSINYLHCGAPKRWYSVPYHAAEVFEKVFKEAMPEQFATQPDLLFQLITMLSPRVLQQHNVPVYTTVQEENNFIITFPGAYHAGFNHGFNCAEAVNFAPPDWLRFAAASVERYRKFRKPSVLSQEELVLKVAQMDLSTESAIWVKRELGRMLKEEAELRYACWAKGLRLSCKFKGAAQTLDSKNSSAEPECTVCHQYLHLSALECQCTPGRQVCLHHADHLCECSPAKWRLLYRHPLAELENIWKGVASRVDVKDAALQPPTPKQEPDYADASPSIKTVPTTKVSPSTKILPYATASPFTNTKKSSVLPEATAGDGTADVQAGATTPSATASTCKKPAKVVREGAEKQLASEAASREAAEAVGDTAEATSAERKLVPEEPEEPEEQAVGSVDVQAEQLPTVVAADPVAMKAEPQEAAATSQAEPMDATRPGAKKTVAGAAAGSLQAEPVANAVKSEGKSAGVPDGEGKAETEMGVDAEMVAPDEAAAIKVEAVKVSVDVSDMQVDFVKEGDGERKDTEGQEVADASVGGAEEDADKQLEEILSNSKEQADSEKPLDGDKLAEVENLAADKEMAADDKPASDKKPSEADKVAADEKLAIGVDKNSDKKPAGMVVNGKMAVAGSSPNDELIVNTLSDSNAPAGESPASSHPENKQEDSKTATTVAKKVATTPPAELPPSSSRRRKRGREREREGSISTSAAAAAAGSMQSNKEPAEDGQEGGSTETSNKRRKAAADHKTKVAARSSGCAAEDGSVLCYSSAMASAMRQNSNKASNWCDKVERLLNKGSAKVSEVDNLLQESQQFLWALGVSKCSALEAELQKARAWAAQVTSCLKSKPSLEQVIPLLAWHPPPVQVASFSKLADSVKAAQALQTRIAAALQVQKGPVDVTALQGLVKEAGKLVVQVPEVAGVQERLDAVAKVVDAITETLKSNAKQGVTLQDLRALHAQAMVLKLETPEKAALQTAISTVEAWQAQAKEALLVKRSMAELQDLLEQGVTMPAAVPEWSSLKSALNKAQAWLKKVGDTTSGNASLKLLRELLHAGERLPVLAPQVETLRLQIRSREWEESAKRLTTNSKCSLSQALDLLEEAERMGASDTRLAHQIKDWVSKAQAWDAEAGKVLQASAQQKQARELCSIQSLQQLMQSGQKLGMKLDKLGALQQLMRRCSSWASSAQQSIELLGQPGAPHLQQLHQLVEAGEGLGVELPELQQLRQLMKAGMAWARKVNAMLQRPIIECTQEDLEDLLAEGQAVGMELDEMEAIKLHQAALHWHHEVQTSFAALFHVSEPTGHLEGAAGRLEEVEDEPKGKLEGGLGEQGENKHEPTGQPEGPAEKQEAAKQDECSPEDGLTSSMPKAAADAATTESGDQGVPPAKQEAGPAAKENAASAIDEDTSAKDETRTAAKVEDVPSPKVVHRTAQKAADETAAAMEVEESEGPNTNQAGSKTSTGDADADSVLADETADKKVTLMEEDNENKEEAGDSNRQDGRSRPQDGESNEQAGSAAADLAAACKDGDVNWDASGVNAVQVAEGEDREMADAATETKPEGEQHATSESKGDGLRKTDAVAASSQATEQEAGSAAASMQALQQEGRAAAALMQEAGQEAKAAAASWQIAEGAPGTGNATDSVVHGSEPGDSDNMAAVLSEAGKEGGKKGDGRKTAEVLNAMVAAVGGEAIRQADIPAATQAAAVGEGLSAAATQPQATAAEPACQPAAAAAEPTQQTTTEKSPGVADVTEAVPAPVLEASTTATARSELGVSSVQDGPAAMDWDGLGAAAENASSPEASSDREQQEGGQVLINVTEMGMIGGRGTDAAYGDTDKPEADTFKRESKVGAFVGGPESQAVTTVEGPESKAAAAGASAQADMAAADVPAGGSAAKVHMMSGVSTSSGKAHRRSLDLEKQHSDGPNNLKRSRHTFEAASADDHRAGHSLGVMGSQQRGAGVAVGRAGASNSAIVCRPAWSSAAARPSSTGVRPELAKAKQLLQQAEQLPVDLGLVSVLAGAVRSAEKWEHSARELLMLHRERAKAGSPPEQKLRVEDVEEMLAEADTIPFKLPAVQQLQQLLARHSELERKAGLLLARARMAADRRPTLQEVAAVQQLARNSAIMCELLPDLDDMSSRAEEWLEACRQLVGRKGMGQRLDKSLQTLSGSLQLVLESLRAVAPSDLPLAPSGSSGDGAERRSRRRKVQHSRLEQPSKQYCLCLQPYDQDPSMICCDNCQDWYHLKCIGLSQQAAKAARKWVCPLCSAVQAGSKLCHSLAGRLRKTGRPSVDQLEALLEEAIEQDVLLTEERTLGELVGLAKQWQSGVEEMLNNHQICREREACEGRSAGQLRPLPESTLREIVKQACAVEVDPGDLGERALVVLGVEAWRQRAKSACGNSTKPSMEQVNKLVKDAESMGLNGEMDLIAKEVKELFADGKQWLDQYRQLLDNLKDAAKHTASHEALDKMLEQVSTLLEDAPAVGLKLDKEVNKLQEVSKRYCLCEQLYDERRPMLSCDYCENWFHYECVGLESPSEDQDDQDMAPEIFRCPGCSLKASITYPFLNKMPAKRLKQLQALHPRAYALATRPAPTSSQPPHQQPAFKPQPPAATPAPASAAAPPVPTPFTVPASTNHSMQFATNSMHSTPGTMQLTTSTMHSEPNPMQSTPNTMHSTSNAMHSAPTTAAVSNPAATFTMLTSMPSLSNIPPLAFPPTSTDLAHSRVLHTAAALPTSLAPTAANAGLLSSMSQWLHTPAAATLHPQRTPSMLLPNSLPYPTRAGPHVSHPDLQTYLKNQAAQRGLLGQSTASTARAALLQPLPSTLGSLDGMGPAAHRPMQGMGPSSLTGPSLPQSVHHHTQHAPAASVSQQSGAKPSVEELGQVGELEKTMLQHKHKMLEQQQQQRLPGMQPPPGHLLPHHQQPSAALAPTSSHALLHPSMPTSASQQPQPQSSGMQQNGGMPPAVSASKPATTVGPHNPTSHNHIPHPSASSLQQLLPPLFSEQMGLGTPLLIHHHQHHLQHAPSQPQPQPQPHHPSAVPPSLMPAMPHFAFSPLHPAAHHSMFLPTVGHHMAHMGHVPALAMSHPGQLAGPKSSLLPRPPAPSQGG